MIFETKPVQSIKGVLQYDAEKKSIDFRPIERTLSPDSLHDSATLVISKTLQLEFRLVDGRLLYIWGYCPAESMENIDKDFVPPEFSEAAIYVKQLDAEKGMGYDSALSNAVIKKFNNDYILVGKDIADKYVEIAQGVVVGLNSNQLTSVIVGPISGIK